ncbi:MAG: metalloregulator ArsR/SmtB family transcription factor [Chthoniobacterales bacterium]
MPKPDAQKRLAQLNAVLNALTHPARRQILMTIHFRGGAMTAGDIAARFRHSWPTTTRHLKVLEDAQLVMASQEGRVRTYRLDLAHLKLVEDWLHWFEKQPR